MMTPVNPELGQLAFTLIYFAAATYGVSFILFTLDFAKAAAPVPALGASPATVAVGGSPVAGVSESGGAPVAQYADSEMKYDRTQFRPQGRAAVAVLGIGVLLHGAAVLLRALAVHRVPWGNMYEFCTTGAFIVAAVYLAVLLKKDLRFLGAFVMGLVVLMLCAAAVGFPTPVGNLVPALQSYWIIIHVSIAVFASALFTLTFAMAVLQLLQTRRSRHLAAGEKDPMPRLQRVPSALALENFAYRINIVGFIFWTFTLIAGAIWANEAWGRYWGWDAKEVWTFVIWVVYAAYFHARATRGWTGVRSAWLSIIGYACIIFNFAVVNVVFKGLHSYSGLK